MEKWAWSSYIGQRWSLPWYNAAKKYEGYDSWWSDYRNSNKNHSDAHKMLTQHSTVNNSCCRIRMFSVNVQSSRIMGEVNQDHLQPIHHMNQDHFQPITSSKSYTPSNQTSRTVVMFPYHWCLLLTQLAIRMPWIPCAPRTRPCRHVQLCSRPCRAPEELNTEEEWYVDNEQLIIE